MDVETNIACTAPPLFASLEPWPEAVALAELLDGVVVVLRRYLILPACAAEAAALWIAHTYVFDHFDHSPRLAITSPERRCGKTRVLQVVGALAHNPLSASHVTAAVVFRAIAAYRPTLLIDEADTFLARDDRLRGILNSGHSRAMAFVLRAGNAGAGCHLFSTWGPVAIAAIGRLPATLADRSIEIRMERRAPGELIERMPARRLELEAEPIRRRFLRWALDARDPLQAAPPPADVPGLDDRAADGWHPLLTIAEQAGGVWSTLARSSALALSTTGDKEESHSIATLLLSDLRALFHAVGSPAHLSTDAILARLHHELERPWPTASKGRPLTAKGLSDLLRIFGVRSARHHGDGLDERVYLRREVEAAADRYCPPPAAGSTNPPHPPGPSQASTYDGGNPPDRGSLTPS